MRKLIIPDALIVLGLVLVGCSRQDPTPTASPATMTAGEFANAVMVQTQIRTDWAIVDPFYVPVTPEQALAWAAEARGRLPASGLNELADCDDFARETVQVALEHYRRAGGDNPPAIGWISRRDLDRGGHMACLFRDPEGRILILEPETGEIAPPSAQWEEEANRWIL